MEPITRRTALRHALALAVTPLISSHLLKARVESPQLDLASTSATVAITPQLGGTARWGAYTDNAPWPDLSPHYALESQLASTKVPIMHWFSGYPNVWPRDMATEAASKGYDLLLTWEMADIDFAEILAGTYDSYWLDIFAAAKSFPRQVHVRLFHEMNANWYTWSVGFPSSHCISTAQWIATWQHIVNLERSAGSGINWVWCPGIDDVGGFSAEAYWPGPTYVDTLGLDAYTTTAAGWKPLYDAAHNMYDRVLALKKAPVWLCEVGCAEDSTQNKALWWQQTLRETRFPKVEALVFFHANKRENWRLDSSTSLTAVLIDYIQHPENRVPPVTGLAPVLNGATGDSAKMVQKLLAMLGYDQPVNGYYGGGTQGNVRKVQRTYSLQVTGDADGTTIATMIQHLPGPTY